MEKINKENSNSKPQAGGDKWETFKNAMASIGIDLAPWEIPMERRLQTLSALIWILLLAHLEIFSIFFSIYLIRTDYWWAMMMYVIYIAYNREKLGANHKQSVRNWKLWHYFRDYFPIKLVKTHDLDPEKNYLFCVFPHGVLCTGVFGNLATEATGFSKIFPGMTPYPVTLAGHFMVPFYREYLSWLGISSAAAENINYLLNPKTQKGNCVSLVVGGAEESMYCHNRQYVVVLKKRRGFVRLAMKNQSSLVPVITFGETDIYETPSNPEGSIVRKLQSLFKRFTGVAPIIPIGRGIFQYSFGFIPQRRPVTTIVGKPIEVSRNMDPTDEQLDLVHAQFVKALLDLFEEHKHKYIENADDVHMIIK